MANAAMPLHMSDSVTIQHSFKYHFLLCQPAMRWSGAGRMVASISNQHYRELGGTGEERSIPQPPPPPRATEHEEPSVWSTEQRTHKLGAIRHCNRLPRVGSRRQIFCLSWSVSEVKPALWRTQQQTQKSPKKKHCEFLLFRSAWIKGCGFAWKLWRFLDWSED